MKAHLIDRHLLVPRSRSSVKVKVKYGYVSQKMGVSEALVFHKHVLFNNVFHSYISLVLQNAVLCGNGLNGYCNSSFTIQFSASS